MATNNGNNGTIESRQNLSHLDRLLEDKPLEVQNKVLRFALDTGMKENDPAFRLVQYIGYLAVLTETAPSEWKDLFKEFEQELEQWSQHHLEQMSSAAAQTQTIKELALTCKSLGTSSNALTLTSETLIEQFRNLIPALNKLTLVKQDWQELSETAQSQDLRNLVKEAVRSELTTALGVQELHLTPQKIQITSELVTTLSESLSKTLSPKMELLMENYQQSLKSQIVTELKSDIKRLIKSELRETTTELSRENTRALAAFNAESQNQKWNWQEWGVAIAGGSVLLGFVLWAAAQFFAPRLDAQTSAMIQQAWERTGWNQTKLERIEKHLGIQPEEKK